MHRLPVASLVGKTEQQIKPRQERKELLSFMSVKEKNVRQINAHDTLKVVSYLLLGASATTGQWSSGTV
jgi:hypothetical protein